MIKHLNYALLKGITISNIIQSSGDIWVSFSDNTFAVLVVNDTTEGFGMENKRRSIF